MINAPKITLENEDGFAYFTVNRRFPKIVRDVAARLPRRSANAIERLLTDVSSGTLVDTEILATPTDFWKRYVQDLQGTTWSRLPFFELEILFYHSINSLAGFFDDGTDVFLETRERALESTSWEPFGRAEGRPPAAGDLQTALLASLLGNASDESQISPLAVPSISSMRLVEDHREQLIEDLLRRKSNDRCVHILLDNIGPELVNDLTLSDTILSYEHTSVVLHHKPWPMFVSDALTRDTLAIIERAIKKGEGPVRATGARLQKALIDQRLKLRADPPWGEPRHFDNLGEVLSRELRMAQTVIAKGDLNYRRFVGDRAWPPDIPVALATRGVQFSAYSLRVLKSEPIAGLKKPIVEELERRDPKWRTNGRTALLQHLGLSQYEPNESDDLADNELDEPSAICSTDIINI